MSVLTEEQVEQAVAEVLESQFQLGSVSFEDAKEAIIRALVEERSQSVEVEKEEINTEKIEQIIRLVPFLEEDFFIFRVGIEAGRASSYRTLDYEILGVSPEVQSNLRKAKVSLPKIEICTEMKQALSFLRSKQVSLFSPISTKFVYGLAGFPQSKLEAWKSAVNGLNDYLQDRRQILIDGYDDYFQDYLERCSQAIEELWAQNALYPDEADRFVALDKTLKRFASSFPSKGSLAQSFRITTFGPFRIPSIKALISEETELKQASIQYLDTIGREQAVKESIEQTVKEELEGTRQILRETLDQAQTLVWSLIEDMLNKLEEANKADAFAAKHPYFEKSLKVLSQFCLVSPDIQEVFNELREASGFDMNSRFEQNSSLVEQRIEKIRGQFKDKIEAISPETRKSYAKELLTIQF